jgi:hypothetical protein
VGSRASLDEGETPPPVVFFFSVIDISLFWLSWLCLLSFTAQHTQNTNIQAGFKPAISASDRPQTLVLDRSVTGIRFPDSPARCGSLYLLSYRCPYIMKSDCCKLNIPAAKHSRYETDTSEAIFACSWESVGWLRSVIFRPPINFVCTKEPETARLRNVKNVALRMFECIKLA